MHANYGRWDMVKAKIGGKMGGWGIQKELDGRAARIETVKMED
jgi:hypothetical protein